MRALEALPSTFEAYHQTAEPTGRVTLGPCWLLPAAAKTLLADAGNDNRPLRMVTAKVPRSSVLVYYSGGEAPSLIVDFRRVSDVKVAK